MLQTHVIFPHLVVSNTEEYFDKPDEFIPERWLKYESTGGCPMHTKKIHPFVSLPFGYGRRSCLGRRFAEIELQILLAKVAITNVSNSHGVRYFCFQIFRKYQVQYKYGPLTYKITPTYVPEQPLTFTLNKRDWI